MQKNTSYRRKIQDRIAPWLDKPDILVVLGPKQVGKSTLLRLIARDIRERWGDEKQILTFDLDDPAQLSALNRDPRYFREFCLFSGADAGRDLVVMIDEIQNLRDPSRFLHCVAETAPSLRLIVTGSTALTHKKYNQAVPEQHRTFDLWPLDFEEFLRFKNRESCSRFLGRHRLQHFIEHGDERRIPSVRAVEDEMRLLFEEFVLYGGFPRVVLAQSQKEKLRCLAELADTLELKGVNVLFDVADISVFRSFFQLLAGCTGDLLNVNELSRTLGIGRDTVRRYLEVLETSFLIAPLPPFHNEHVKELKKMPRIYFCDTGLRNFAITNFAEMRFRPDKEALFKNAVCCELLKNLDAQNRLFFWRTVARNRVDFVVTGAHRLAFQVTAIPNGDAKRFNGFKAFERIYHGFRKFVIDFDQLSNQDTITYLPGWMV